MASDSHGQQAKDSMAKFGYVEVKSKHLKIYKRRWLVLYKSVSSHTASLIKYKDEESFKIGKQRAEYMVTNFWSVERLPQDQRKHAVVIYIKESVADITDVTFSCNSDTEANDWVEHIKKEMASLSSLNDEFPVYLVPNQFLTVKGEMVMRVRGGWLSLCDSNKRIIREWELTRIRRYKEENINTFWIECSRTSETDEGKLTFTSTAAHCILERIHEEAVNLIKKSKPPAWISQEISNLSAQVPIGINKQPMLRRPTKPDYPLMHQHFVSEPDLSDFAGYYPKQVGRQPKFRRPFLSESTHSSSPQDNSCTDNIYTAWSTKGGKISCQDDQRDSGYLDLTSESIIKKSVQKSFTLPSPPPIADEINLLGRTQSLPPLRQDELQDMEVFASQSFAGPGRGRCFTDPKLEGIPEADFQLDLPGDHMYQRLESVHHPPPDNTDSRQEGIPETDAPFILPGDIMYHRLESVRRPPHDNTAAGEPSTEVASKTEIPDLPKHTFKSHKLEPSGS